MESLGTLTNRSRNTCRVILAAFGNFLKKRGYLPADRPTAFQGMCVWKDEINPVTIYTAEEMRTLLDQANVILLPYLAIGAFAGLRNAEISRLDWKHIRFDRGFIECEASMTKTRQRRLVPISENLRAWLEPIAQPSGPIVSYQDVASVVCEFGHRIGLTWKRNALRHSYISYRLALVPDTARVALECGNSPDVIFQHYRELTEPAQAQEWFSIIPPADYPQCLARRYTKTCKPAWQRAA
jgi:integrase